MNKKDLAKAVRALIDWRCMDRDVSTRAAVADHPTILLIPRCRQTRRRLHKWIARWYADRRRYRRQFCDWHRWATWRAGMDALSPVRRA